MRAEEKLANAHIPRFSDGTYLCVLSPTQMRQLKLDPDFKTAATFPTIEGVRYSVPGDWAEVADLVEQSYRNTAPARLVRQLP